jgi:hypothetical protein
MTTTARLPVRPNHAPERPRETGGRHVNSEKKPGKTDAQHRGKTDEARPQEGGRAGGQPMNKGERLREPETQEDLEREKAERGTGSPA